ncbi:spike base protein, RCAP_Rcc01079 family [Leisingera sp. ANG-M6]|uniref:spike base protein, RCAP_Rcc01079 family n=1 Tax=Leisingera sp. ANG-M6 TaxID=1577900 RepID=UPI00057F89A0|nr:hypothetical protein [Leisingera sp. ANG-M6]KIC27212.1 hypothetical protein RA24_15205 [Leisingera sp. ANG-M6]
MPQIDPFTSFCRGLESPATHHLSITPQDGVDLPVRPRVLRVLASGDLAMRDEAGTVMTYAVTAGETIGFSAVGIEATGTTASVAGWY